MSRPIEMNLVGDSERVRPSVSRKMRTLTKNRRNERRMYKGSSLGSPDSTMRAPTRKGPGRTKSKSLRCADFVTISTRSTPACC
jgi:hypothetical protein